MKVEFEKYISKLKEVLIFGDAYQVLFDTFEELAEQFADNLFITTCDLDVIKEWEHFLSIPADDTLSLEDRRNQVIAFLNTKPPYTFNNMKKQIYSFTGIENEIIEDRANLSITINLTGASQGAIKLVNQYMKRIKPVNIVYKISTTPGTLYDESQSYQACIITRYITVI